MAANPFYRLAPFIQEYIYRNKWESLREAQVKAINAILDTSNHVLISSATASGKTEAALLPIITDLHDNPPATIGVMYIGPLKALINDQFERLAGLLEGTDIPVQSWHGDISQSKKTKFLKRSQGILQITPESLEAMLINRHHEIGRLFSDLRYVIIDEIHAFLDTDRGRQVMCQLERLSRYQQNPSRRIGLSATLGEPEIAMDWLKGNSITPVTLIEVRGGGKVELGLEYFLLADDDEDVGFVEELDEVNDAENNTLEYEDFNAPELEDTDVFYDHLHQMTQRVAKTLIFANARGDTENIVVNLRQISERKNLPSFYHVHHGSISAPLRESAEEAMRNTAKKSCIAATITLELGIDVGQLDQVIQVNSTHSVSSFVQRLGRSGRRGDPSRMFFYSTQQSERDGHIGKDMPWNFLQTIAIIQLYLEERWIEPPSIPLMPLSLLYHQTMSTIKSHTELLPPQLAERILTLSAFQNITQDHFRQFLHHLIKIEHLEQTDIGGLIIGYKAERIVDNYRFYATFEDEVTYRVRDKSREIGTIQSAPEVGSTIGLAGFTWKIIDVDNDKRVINVVRAKGKVKSIWTGGGIQIHTRIIQKIREILLSSTEYPYLHDRASLRLKKARNLAQNNDLNLSSILPLAPNRFIVFPWCGTRQFVTQILMLNHVKINIPSSYSPYYYELVHESQNLDQIKKEFAKIINTRPTSSELVADIDETELRRNKYDQYVPPNLLREAYSRDFIDIQGGIDSLRDLES
jgi:ATP-dependent helicase Lhr and Lhr-like helicase